MPESSTYNMPGIEAGTASEPWQTLRRLIANRAEARLIAFLRMLPASHVAYTIDHLSEDEQRRLFQMLAQIRPTLAASLMEHFVDEKVAELLEDLDPEQAAAIVDNLPSDDQADILNELDDADARAILDRMHPEEAADARGRLHYDAEAAGGLMITEYLSYREDQDVDDVIHDLRTRAMEMNQGDFELRYVYLRNDDDELVGVVTMRSLLVSRTGSRLGDLALRRPRFVTVDTPLHELETFFDSVRFSALPVVDHHQRLVGVVQRVLVQEALGERASQTFLKFSGIIGGEELRSMPTVSRAMRRMAFLLPSVALSYVAVSIIAVYEPVIENLTALAIFLPMVANLSGAAGNQAVAVSIRELALGLVTDKDVMRVWGKEVYGGLINGVVIGLLLALITFMTRSEHPIVAVAVGGAYLCSCVMAVVSGGALPLLLRKMGVDPAMMSSPILTTITDMFSFFLVLSFASLLLILFY